MYQPRKGHKSKVTLSVVRLYSLQGRGRTADQKNLQPKLNGQLCYELLKQNFDSTIDFLSYHLDCWSELYLAETQAYQDF